MLACSLLHHDRGLKPSLLSPNSNLTCPLFSQQIIQRTSEQTEAINEADFQIPPHNVETYLHLHPHVFPSLLEQQKGATIQCQFHPLIPPDLLLFSPALQNLHPVHLSMLKSLSSFKKGLPWLHIFNHYHPLFSLIKPNFLKKFSYIHCTYRGTLFPRAPWFCSIMLQSWSCQTDQWPPCP